MVTSGTGPIDPRQHWDRVYTTKDEAEVSWFETVPAVSLRLMEAWGLTPDQAVVPEHHFLFDLSAV